VVGHGSAGRGGGGKRRDARLTLAQPQKKIFRIVTAVKTSNLTRGFHAHNLRARMPSRPSSLKPTAQKLVTYLSTHNLNTQHEHNTKCATHLQGINIAEHDACLVTAILQMPAIARNEPQNKICMLPFLNLMQSVAKFSGHCKGESKVILPPRKIKGSSLHRNTDIHQVTTHKAIVLIFTGVTTSGLMQQ
jgi:hypothetical protein